jgi:hypothetical protein
MATALVGDGVDIEELQDEFTPMLMAAPAPSSQPPLPDHLPPSSSFHGLTKNHNKNHHHRSLRSFSGGFLRRTEDSLASMGSLLGNLAFQHNEQHPPESLRSKQRYRCNIILGILLLLTTLGLTTTLLGLAYVNIIRPARRKAALQAKIHAQAIYDATLVQKCANISWQTACSALLNGGTGAGARRQRRRRLEDEADFQDDHDEDMTLVEDPLERQFLYSDVPTVRYDADCIREYRLSMMWNITFPYRSNQLLTKGGQHSLALFIQHGALRDASEYFCSFMHLMREQTYRPFNDILIIAPHFQYQHDDFLHPRDAYWNTTKPWGDVSIDFRQLDVCFECIQRCELLLSHSQHTLCFISPQWRVGAESDPNCCGSSGHTISSFNVLDNMLGILTNRQLYPRLNKISFLGHSAGGQMVQRYAVMSALAALWDLGSDLTVRFVIANPSSYTYLDNQRLEYNCGNCACNRRNCTCDANCTKPAVPRWSVPYHHGVGTQFPCYQWNYDRWPYGLGSFSSSDYYYYIPYALRDGLAGPERALRVYRDLDVVYLVGQNDTCNDGLPQCDGSCWKRNTWLPGENKCFRNQMDARCPAMLQGWCRRTRAYNYMHYLQHLYSKPTHTLYEIPGVGHNATAIFGSDIGMEVLFGP